MESKYCNKSAHFVIETKQVANKTEPFCVKSIILSNKVSHVLEPNLKAQHTEWHLVKD